MKNQIVVRSFAPNSTKSAYDLEKALKAGYKLVRASEFIPAQGSKVGYIEYILEEDEDSPEEEKLREELEALREKLREELEALREKLNRVRAEKEDLEAYIEAMKYTADLQRKDTLKTLVMLTEAQRTTANKHETIYAEEEGLFKWITEVKESLKAAISATEEEISEAAEEGGAEC